MPDLRFPISIRVPYGKSNQSSVYILDDDGTTWHKVDSYEFYKIEKRLNNIWSFEVKFIAISDTEKDYIKERAIIMFFMENNLFLRGRLQKVEYGTAWDCTVSGIAEASAKLLDREYENSTRNPTEPKRVTYTDVSAQTIQNELLSLNSDGASPWIVQPASNGLFDTDYGTLSMRFENGNRLNAFAKTSEAMDYDWWETWSGDDYSTLRMNCATSKGSDNGISFIASGASQNCYLTTKERDIENLVNDVTTLGFGEGDTQLSTNTYAASSTWTTLDSSDTGLDGAINATITTITVKSTSDFPSSGTIKIDDEQITYTGTTSTTFTSCTRGANATSAAPHDDNIAVLQYTQIDLVDASSFSSTGTIRVMEEQITYTGKSNNTITGITRGANSTTEKAHKKGCYIEKYVAKTQSDAESGTTMDTYGILDYSVTDKSIKNLQTLELAASKILIDRKDVIERYTITPDDPFYVVENVSLGDTLSLTDTESDISGSFRVVGIILNDEYGIPAIELECSNRGIRFIEQLQKEKEEKENLAKYSQGHSNVYQVFNAENCESGKNLDLRFFIPNDVISIEKVRLNYRIKDYRTYSTTQQVASGKRIADTAVTEATVDGANYSVGASDHGNLTFCFIHLAIREDLPDSDVDFNVGVFDGTDTYNCFCDNIGGGADIRSNFSVWVVIPGDTAGKTLTVKLHHNESGGNYDVTNVLHVQIFEQFKAISENTNSVSDVAIEINGEDVTSSLESHYGTLGTGNDENLELVSYSGETFNIGAWNTISIKPDAICRIEGSAFVQVFVEGI